PDRGWRVLAEWADGRTSSGRGAPAIAYRWAPETEEGVVVWFGPTIETVDWRAAEAIAGAAEGALSLASPQGRMGVWRRPAGRRGWWRGGETTQRGWTKSAPGTSRPPWKPLTGRATRHTGSSWPGRTSPGIRERFPPAPATTTTLTVTRIRTGIRSPGRRWTRPQSKQKSARAQRPSPPCSASRIAGSSAWRTFRWKDG